MEIHISKHSQKFGTESTIENEMEKEKLENIIKEYMTNHAGLNVMCDPDGDGVKRVHVNL